MVIQVRIHASISISSKLCSISTPILHSDAISASCARFQCPCCIPTPCFILTPCFMSMPRSISIFSKLCSISMPMLRSDAMLYFNATLHFAVRCLCSTLS
ncbi:hypothetical protein M430DRAFT_253339 [Amorphotheca resinae ATCC 22711]|uniref:Uncharacterized protein n=1 Tax=Amorphotheca resinae ATCC 22711 TaxID=857342 RepID=A0A2T3AXS9_AMORE|nr:hypothetical protein M430DRAFT_253339 [Amorphotheca resinae ATCC 22711]PSS14832.1 hypothetical protein M430DRAFT_253339 [Amorphotheca resinae ATCC 22711]